MQYQKRVELRAKKKAEWEKRKREEDGLEEEDEEDGETVKVERHPYEKELALVADLIRYCKFFLPKDQVSGIAAFLL